MIDYTLLIIHNNIILVAFNNITYIAAKNTVIAIFFPVNLYIISRSNECIFKSSSNICVIIRTTTIFPAIEFKMALPTATPQIIENPLARLCDAL